MRIEIVKIIKEQIVEFSSAIGSGVGVWKSKDMKRGGIYDVEFDIIPLIEIGQNATIIFAESCYIKHNGMENEIQGILNGLMKTGYAIYD